MKKTSSKIIKAVEYSIQNPTMSITKVGELFGVDRHSIARYKKNNEYLNYTVHNQGNPDDENLYYFTEDELKEVEIYLNNPKKSYKELNLSIDRRAMYRWIKILGEQKTAGKSHKYDYDRTKFKEILTEEDAYWLGFITADGCIIENRWLQIQLAEKDIGHLKKFCKYIGLNEEETEEIIKEGFGGAYTRDNPVRYVRICSLDILTHLNDKGITTRKSGKEKPFICSTIDLEKAYIRGLLDGDGYIRRTQYGMGIVGSHEICEYVQDFINNNVKDISKNKIHEHGIIWKLELSGINQCSEILKYFYEDANIYLDRKYQLFMEMYN